MIFIYLLFSRGLGQLRLRKNKRYLMLLGLLNALQAYATSPLSNRVEFPLQSFFFIQLKYMLMLAPTILGELNSRKSLLLLLLAAAVYYLLLARKNFWWAWTEGHIFRKALFFAYCQGCHRVQLLRLTWLRRDNSDILNDWDKFSSYLSPALFPLSHFYFKTSIL